MSIVISLVADPGDADRPLHPHRTQFAVDLGSSVPAGLVGLARLRAGRAAAAICFAAAARAAPCAAYSKALDPGAGPAPLREPRRARPATSRAASTMPMSWCARAAPRKPIERLRQALTRPVRSDPNLLLGLARAQFASGAFGGGRADARGADRAQPRFARRMATCCMRARSRAKAARQALEEYAAVTRYYAGAEAPLRYAQLLRSQRPARGGAPGTQGAAGACAPGAALLPAHAARMAVDSPSASWSALS